MVGILPVGAVLVAARRTLPGVAGAGIAVELGVAASAREAGDAKAGECLADLGARIQKQRQQEQLGVPEVAAAIGLAGGGLGVDGTARVVLDDGAEQMIERDAQRELALRVAIDDDIGTGPALGPDGVGLGGEAVEAGGGGSQASLRATSTASRNMVRRRKRRELVDTHDGQVERATASAGDPAWLLLDVPEQAAVRLSRAAAATSIPELCGRRA